MFAHLLENLHRQNPVIHNITNYVTANDCANLLLACGASPVMADDPAEAAGITARSRGLTLNLGTFHTHTLPAMLAAGRQANALGLPVVLDPVGVGASALRADAARQLLGAVRFAVIRGNLAEITALLAGTGGQQGVDDAVDAIRPDNLDRCLALVQRLAARTGAVVAATGALDLAGDGQRAFVVRNGHPILRRITGTGCQLSCLTTAFVAANPGQPLESAAAALCALGLCGEIAHSRLGPLDGSASCRTWLIDAMYNLTPRQLEEGARYELR